MFGFASTAPLTAFDISSVRTVNGFPRFLSKMEPVVKRDACHSRIDLRDGAMQWSLSFLNRRCTMVIDLVSLNQHAH
jgi:hypothetical protein